jgi:YggT family protein
VFFLINLINVVAQILFFLILARVVLSWVRPNSYNRTFREIEQFIYQATEPILAPIRRIMPPMGGLDLSPMLAIILVEVVAGILRRLLLG